MTIYRQCKLAKKSTFYTAWIPEEFAKKGKIIKIDGQSGLWRVEEAYDSKMTETDIDIRRKGRKDFEEKLGKKKSR